MQGRSLERYKRIQLRTGAPDRPFKLHVRFVCKNTTETNVVLTQTLSNSFGDVGENGHAFPPVRVVLKRGAPRPSPRRESNLGHGGDSVRSSPLDLLGRTWIRWLRRGLRLSLVTFVYLILIEKEYAKKLQVLRIYSTIKWLINLRKNAGKSTVWTWGDSNT